MIEIISMGEALVEIMREKVGIGLDRPAVFLGPYPSGAPAIFADCAARLGAKVGFVGTVGKDDFGKVIRDRLQQDGLDLTYFAEKEEATTGCAFVAYFPDGSRKFIYHIKNAASGIIEPDRVPATYFQGAHFLHINGSALSINPAWQKSIYQATEVAKKQGVKITLDPNLRPEILGIDQVRAICSPVIESAYALFPSGEEAMMLTGEKDPERACLALLEAGVELVVLKQGDQGSTIYQKEGHKKIPAFSVEEVDPTGAGDCFDAGFLVGLLRGYELEKCGRIANAVGALAVTKKGPMEGAPSLSEVEKFIKEL
ncbi:MAG: hypothetical protein PWP04_1322 [Candidatus Atribacteria bacterium]|nr:hypothetical protein [Candidatus Atribacteria bacterium]